MVSSLLTDGAGGFGTDDDIVRSRAAGFDVHLTKPAEPQRLLRVIVQPPRAG